MLSGHDEQLSHHPATLTNVLLHQFATADPDELAIRMMRYCSSQEGLACSWRTVQEDTLRLCDTQRLEQFRMLHRELDDFLDLFNLLVETTDHLVRAVRDFLDHHERNQRVYFIRENFVNGVRVGAESNTEGSFELVDVDFRVKVDD